MHSRKHFWKRVTFKIVTFDLSQTGIPKIKRTWVVWVVWQEENTFLREVKTYLKLP